MADVLINSSAQSQTELRNTMWGAYFANQDDCVLIRSDGGSDLTTDFSSNGGTTWTPTEIVAGNVKRIACFADWEVPGGTGTIVHVVWLDVTDDTLYYVDVDAADGTSGTIRTIDNTLTVSATDTLNRLALCKTRSGNLVVAGSTQTELFCYESSDQFATAATSLSDVYEAATEEDWCLLFPANTGDGDDVCAIFQDRSVNQLTVKMLDRSNGAGGTWSETLIRVGVAEVAQYRNFDGSARHSDGKILLAYLSENKAANSDLGIYEINPNSISSPTITAKTDIFTNVGGNGQPSMVIDQNTDDIYVAYCKGNFATVGSQTDVVFHKSTDGGATWGSEQAFSENTGTNVNPELLGSTRSITSAEGRVMWCWYAEGDNDFYTNTNNAVVITASSSDDLTSDDIASTSSVGAPVITQVHALTSSDISSATTVGTPTLTEDVMHALEADDIASTASVGTPVITQVHALVADDIASTTSVGTPTLVEGGDLPVEPDDLSIATAVGNPTLQENNNILDAFSLASTTTVGQPTLTIVGGTPAFSRAKDLRILVNGVDYGMPQNWRQLQFTYDFNGLDLLNQDLPGNFEYCGKEPYEDLLTQVREAVCGEIELQVQVICWPLVPDWESIYDATAKLTDATFICGGNPPCQVNITANRFNAFAALEESATDEICIDCENVSTQTDDIRIRQIQTGGVHIAEDGVTENTRCFVPVDELISAMVDEVGYISGNGIGSDVWAFDFQHEVNRITIPNTSDAQIVITVISEWGTTHSATINFIGGESLAERAEFVKKALLGRNYATGISASGFSPRAHQIFHDISAIRISVDADVRPAYVQGSVSVRAAGQLDIITDWPVNSIVVSGDVNGTLNVDQLQAYQYGLGNIMFSTNGLDIDGICLTWAELKAFMTCVHPTVFLPTDKNFTYAGYDAIFNSQVAAITQGALQPKQVSWRVREDILHNKGLFGQRSLLEDVEIAEDNWLFYGSGNQLDAARIGHISPTDFISVDTAIGATTVAGTITFSGDITIVNPTGSDITIFLSMWEDNTGTTQIVGESSAITIAAGTTKVVNVFNQNLFNPQAGCINSGVNMWMRVRTISGGGGLIFPGISQDSFRYDIHASDFDAPLITDDSAFLDFDPYYDFSDFSSCTGIRDCEVNSKFYTGLGFAFTQQLNFLADYEDLIFCAFRFPGSGSDDINSNDDQTWMFQREWYFNSLGTPPTCYDKKVISYYFHNMPLQHPWLAAEWAKYVPSSFAADRYSYDNILTSGGTGVEPSLTQANQNFFPNGGLIEKAHSRTKLYEFTDCISLISRIFRGLERATSFQHCDQGTRSGILRKMPKRLDDQGVTQFVVEAE
jgi:hypothetical protein